VSQAPEVHSITAAPVRLTDEQSGRTRRYLISMGLRTACVLLAIVVPGWPKWIFIAGAVLLPYLAVVAANATRSRRGTAPISPIETGPRQLPSGPGPRY